MIRLSWIIAALALASASGHFGYLHIVAPPAAQSERPELAWLQRELDLTPVQFVEVRALHEECWEQVATLRQQLAAERRNARASGNPAACVAVEDQCKSCTVTFVRRMNAVLSPSQQQKYLRLVEACLPPSPPSQGASVEPTPGR